MSKDIPFRSFKVFVRYKLDGEEKEFFFFKDVNPLETDHMIATPLIAAGQSMLNRNLGWDADRLASFKVWWTERPYKGLV